MKSVDDGFIKIGKIGSTYGVKGWLKVLTYTEFGASILDYQPWYLLQDNQWQPVALEDGKLHGKHVIAKLAGVDTPEAARAYTGKLISILRNQLPDLPKEEYYWSDLVGLTVVNQNGVVFGKVIYLMETGSNDVLVVKGDSKEHAIPYLPGKVVKKVDLAKQEIVVDWELI